MIKRIAPIFALLLGLMGMLSTANAVRHAPAFAEGLRIEGLAGSTRTENRAAMYTRSDYLMQTGAGFVNADAYSFATIEAPDEIASPEVVAERARRGAELLTEAVSRDPSNAHTWFVYAQALAATGRPEAAFAALGRSRALSPTMPRLAYLRSWVLWGLLQGAEFLPMEASRLSGYREIYAAERDLARTATPEEHLPPPLAAAATIPSRAPVPATAEADPFGAIPATPALPADADPEATASDLHLLALDLAVADPGAAAIAFARAAVRGHERSAYYLGQLYETADGVPYNLHLARAWYAAASMPEEEQRLEEVAEPATAAAPTPPRLLSAARTGDGAVELVWTSDASGGASFLVEVFAEDGSPVASEELSLSALRLDIPSDPLAWRVTALQGDVRAPSDLQTIPAAALQ
ncbi:tetratricopeptide repeat protein [Roseitranquillus sediminis]|uniref:tetratricopeptide repeat protein n=1 Tax=Roseitranquillus sediminis TaxID=2809051 RepID=UPI001D0CD3F8|nr:tetratricopeptide repeat protein [Roseitranquillus sediminis]MBM9594032.1 hypothetical protein [Roseitranquillus sediminis]